VLEVQAGVPVTEVAGRFRVSRQANALATRPPPHSRLKLGTLAVSHLALPLSAIAHRTVSS
jgi:hypothetical protein